MKLKVEELKLDSIDATDYTASVKAGTAYTFDGKVIAKYNDGTTKDVTNLADIGSISTEKAGEKDLTISYVENNITKSVTKKIEVTKELASISISGYKASFELNETFSFTGSVTAKYSDNSTDVVTSKATITHNVDTSKLGTYQINASYTEGGITKTDSVDVVVTEHIPVLQSISVSGFTDTVDKGSTYTFDGTVMAHFDEGPDVDVTSACTIPSVNTSTKGTKQITISYTDPNKSSNTKTSKISITVVSRVTGISVNSSMNIGVGQTKPLNATALPADADNPGLTYSSNKTGVATVSDTGSVTGVAVGSATITITSLDVPSVTQTVTINVSEIAKDEWTILIYMCGADLESDSSQGGAATMDLQEIAQVSGQPSDVNVVVQAGGAKSWKSTYSSVINASKRNRFHLSNKAYVKDSQADKVNMGLASTLQDFLEWGLETYPADKVGLIFWNHGGAMTGACFDEQFGDDGLTTAETTQAIRAAKLSTGYSDKFEFIGYDCCLMQIHDVAGLNAEFAKYQVASEESEWGYGWTYNEWIDDVFANKSTTTILKAIVDSFASETTSAYSYWGESNDQTLSYLDLSYWDSYKTAWENMASTLSGIITSKTNWSTFASMLNTCQRYGESYGSYPYDIFDIGTFFTKIKAHSTYKNNSTLMSNVNAVQSIYNNLVAYEWHGSGAGNSSGLTLFAPVYGNYMVKSLYGEDYTPFTTWRTLCINRGNWYY